MRGILFDKDGTLIDFRASWSQAFRDLCLELCDGDATAAEALLERGGMELASGHCAAGSVLAAGNTLDIVRCWFPELSGDAMHAQVQRIDRMFYANGVRYSVLLPGVRDTLGELTSRGFAMGVATSDGTAGARAALAMLGIDVYLPHVFGYDSVAQSKPAPDMVGAFAAAAGLAPSEIVVIGDNTHDLLMAQRAGAGAAIGVLSGTGGEGELRPLADAILESVCDLPGWLADRDAKELA